MKTHEEEKKCPIFAVIGGDVVFFTGRMGRERLVDRGETWSFSPKKNEICCNFCERVL